MMNSWWRWGAVFSLIWGFATQAQQAEIEAKTIFSKVLDEQREISVMLPSSYKTTPTKKYPVIYRLDGAANLPLISAVLNNLKKAEAAPEVIVVAIENTDRLRDLAPTVNRDPRGPVGQGGGSDKFLSFIESELIPFVNANYRTHDYKILSGASVAGLFTIYSLQSKPELFQAHIAYSPAVWWGDRTTAKNTKQFLTKQSQLDTYLYMNIGSEGGEMRAVYDDLSTYIEDNKPKGFAFKADVFAQTPHGLTSTAGIYNAYKNLFLPLWMSPQSFTGEVNSVAQYYQQVSIQRGEEIKAPEWIIRELAYHSMRNRDLDTAIELFQYNISLYPNTAEAYNGLAYGYEENKQYAEALAQVNLALEFAKKDEPGYHIFIDRKNRLTSLLK